MLNGSATPSRKRPFEGKLSISHSECIDLTSFDEEISDNDSPSKVRQSESVSRPLLVLAGDSASKVSKVNVEAEELASAIMRHGRVRGGSAADRSLFNAKAIYLTEDAKSWIVLAKHWRPSRSDEFKEQWELHPTSKHQLKLYGRVCHETRYSQSWGLSYSYSGGVNQARALVDNPFVQSLIDTCNILVPTHGPYNACLQNWYEPKHSIALHSDDERSHRRGSPIFSLSWGGPRRFIFRAKPGAVAKQQILEFLLEDGDLLVMGGSCQATHKHEVPPVRKTKDLNVSNRINWTIRAFA